MTIKIMRKTTTAPTPTPTPIPIVASRDGPPVDDATNLLQIRGWFD